MNTSIPPSPAREELWFARLCLVIGAYQFIIVGLNAFTLLKLQLGVTVVSHATGGRGDLEPSLLIFEVVAGLIIGGGLATGNTWLSRLAYGRPVPRAALLGAVEIPTTLEILGLALRGFGAVELVKGIYSISTAIHDWHYLPHLSTTKHPAYQSSLIWALEHFTIGVALMMFGGILARWLLRQRKPAEPG